jgi:hypothetical protein
MWCEKDGEWWGPGKLGVERVKASSIYGVWSGQLHADWVDEARNMWDKEATRLA